MDDIEYDIDDEIEDDDCDYGCGWALLILCGLTIMGLALTFKFLME